MKVETVTVVEPEFIRVTAVGDYVVEAMFGFIDHVWSEAMRTGRTRALMDCTSFRGQMTEAERFMGGQRIAQVFGGRLKAALLMPVGQITKLGELAAVNRGARFLVTESEGEALEWLLSP